MNRTVLAFCAAALVAPLAGCSSEPTVQIELEDDWFELFAPTEGEEGRVAFALSRCALMSCGIADPFLVGHENVLIVRALDGESPPTELASSDDAVMTITAVDGQFHLHAKGVGDAVIIARDADGTERDRVAVGVREAAGIEITRVGSEEGVVLPVGDRDTALGARAVTPLGHGLISFGQVEWQVAETSVLDLELPEDDVTFVPNQAILVPIEPGATEVTASLGDFSEVVTITVE